jgi:hypothetical protein
VFVNFCSNSKFVTFNNNNNNNNNSKTTVMNFHHLIFGLLLHRVNGFFYLQRTASSSISSSTISYRASSRIIVSVDENYTKKSRRSIEEDEGYQYPWSTVQDYVLRDSLPKFTIRIPVEQKNSSSSSSSTSISTAPGKIETRKNKEHNVVFSSFALWRSLIEETPELSGYPIDFLQARYNEQQTRGFKSDDEDEKVTKEVDLPPRSNTTTIPTILEALPFLDDYEFSNEGGICGNVYGLDCVADGSRITTPAVINVKESLPKGYIQTSDGSALFELGRPKGNDERRINGHISDASYWKTIPSGVAVVAKKSIENAAGTVSNIDLNAVSYDTDDADGLLLRLGATTGILLAGATAINMLSHHMTVNVFWV